mmetsp:Transcript_16904/g.26007  ORF Transcript_16904/g.26007 Transcript_16904/m.26007 type:complete len:110 (+) Transcript_16904:228-557(+)|eukprot:CAMPEP_0170502290 /NCGR_PEP_ID=MMETSP0208-20121228/41087_1 /TAXON_ID=197538 /ORGANISM="Strombidium inclinatum, Strain S3" /LENGTH=109 /DNA_ID=CAMNT_0010781291 /DNA_START=148 /DNA_END=477 /DNA_ORIENTATION=+
MMMQNVASFLPTYVEARREEWEAVYGTHLTSTDNAIIIGVFSVAQILFAPFNALIKNTLGSKNTIIFGFLLMTATTFGLGAIANLESPIAFEYVAVLLRFFQGQGDVLL